MRNPARSTRKSLRRLKRAARRLKAPGFILGTALAFALPQVAKSATLTWDPDGNFGNSIFGGAGTWDNSSKFWSNGTTDVAWPGGTNLASFGGTGGTVTLGAPISAGGLLFSTNGYKLSNGGNAANTLTLNGTAFTFNISSGVTVENGTNGINSTDGVILTGSAATTVIALTKDLPGTLILNNTNSTFTGRTAIKSGVLTVTKLADFGLASSIGTAGIAGTNAAFFDPSIILDGGTLRYIGMGDSTNRILLLPSAGTIDSSGTGASLGFSASSAGLQFGASGGSRTLTLTGTNTGLNSLATSIGDPSGTEFTSIVKSGTGTWVGSSTSIYKGSTTVSGGTLMVSLLNVGGQPSGLGGSTSAPANLVLNGGTLKYFGQTSGDTDRSFTVGSNGGTIDSSGTQAISFSGTGFLATNSTGGNRTLTLTGSTLGNVFRPAVADPNSAFALGNTNNILKFDPAAPDVTAPAIVIDAAHGLLGSDVLQAIDFAPSVTTNQFASGLYALGTASNGSGHLYQINLQTGVANPVGSFPSGTFNSTSTFASTFYGLDVNPVTNTIRLVADMPSGTGTGQGPDQNYRLTLTGTLTPDGTLAYNASTNSTGIRGLAYSNNVNGATSTTLYGIDIDQKNLVTINPENGGVVNIVGGLKIGTLAVAGTFNPSTASGVGFDITQSGFAFAALSNGSTTKLYSVDLSTGLLSAMGNIDAGQPISIRSLAFGPEGIQGTTSLVKSGLGSWSLDRIGMSFGNTYTGSTTINQGTLTLNFNQGTVPTSGTSTSTGSLASPKDNLINPRSALAMNGGTIAIVGQLSNFIAGLPYGPFDHQQGFNGLTLGRGASVFTATPGSGFIGTGGPIDGGSITVSLGTITHPNGVTGATIAFPSTPGTTFNTTSTNTGGILGPWAIWGNDYAAVNGSGVIGATTSYTDSTSTTLSGHANIAAGVTTTNLAGSTTITTLHDGQLQGTTINVPSGQKLTTSGILVGAPSGTTSLAISGGTLTAPGGTELIVFSNAASQSQTGATGATNTSNGTLKLKDATGVVSGALVSGPNIQPGTRVISVSGTTVTLTAIPTAAADGGTYVFSNITTPTTTQNQTGATGATVTNSTTLKVNDATGVVAGALVSGPNIVAGTRVLSVSGTTITMSAPALASANGGTFSFSSNLSIGSTITDNGTPVSVTFAGTGITTLSATNTYTGGTLLTSGAVHLANPAAIPGTITVGRGTGLPIIASDGFAVRDIRNNFVFDGDLQLGDAVGTGQLTLSGTLDLNGGNRTFSSGNAYNAISGTIINGALTKSGPNTLALTGTNTYAGGTYLMAGNLDVESSGALGTGPVYLQGGDLSSTGGLTAPLSNLIFLVSNSTLGRTGVFEGLDLGGTLDLGNTTPPLARVLTIAGPQARISGNIVNGTLSKAGTSDLYLTGSSSSYSGQTIISNGSIRAVGSTVFGQNVFGNDVLVKPSDNTSAIVRLSSPSSLGDRQLLYLNNVSQLSIPILGLGAGFANSSGQVDFINFNDPFFDPLTQAGLHYVEVNDNNGGDSTITPFGIALDGIKLGEDLVAKAAVASSAPVYLGATTLNGIYTGGSLSTSRNGNYYLGGGGGVLTIQSGDVLTGQANLTVGAFDATNRGLAGVVFIPYSQSYGGASNTITVGNSGTLVVGVDGALGDATNTINLFSGTLNLKSDSVHGTAVPDAQYVGRVINLATTNSTLNVDPLGGGQQGVVQLGGLNFLAQNLNLSVNISQTFDLRLVGPINLLAGTAGTTTFSHNSGFITADGGIVGDIATAFTKTGGGTMILTQPAQYGGLTTINGGVLALTVPNAVTGNLNLGAGTLSLRSDSASPVAFDFGQFAQTGTGTIYVGPIAATAPGTYAGTTIQVPGLNSGLQTALTINGELNYALQMTGALNLTGATNAASAFTLTVNSARTELLGGIIGTVGTGGTLPDFAKAGIGVLTLSGPYTLNPANPAPPVPTPSTFINQGVVVANHGDGSAIVDVFGSGALALGTTSNIGSSGLLVAGARTLDRAVAVNSVGGNQVLGGLDAGAKLFSGDISLTTTAGSAGVYLTAESGGDVTFSGTISGGAANLNIGSLTSGVLTSAAGTAALGRGNVILAPATDNGNSFTVPLVVNNGTVVGQAQASGSPFGNGATTNLFSVVNGTLQLNGRATATAHSVTATQGELDVSGNATVAISDVADTFNTQLSVGSLNRVGTGTLSYVPLNGTGEEQLHVNAAPVLINGIIPWAVRATSAANNAGDFATVDGNNNLVVASYTAAELDTVTANQVVSITSGGPLSMDRSVYALKTAMSLNLGGKTLHVGDVANLNATSAGGIILNSGAGISNGTLDFGNAEGVIYVDSASPATISAPITSGLMAETRNGIVTAGSNTITNLASTARLYVGMPVSGSGITGGSIITSVGVNSVTLSAGASGGASSATFGNVTSLTKLGNGVLVLAASNTYRGATVINDGTLQMGVDNAIGRYTNAGAIGASPVIVAAGATLELNGFATEIGNLAGSFGSVVNLGTGRLTVGRTNTNSTFSGQLIGDASSVFQKVGAATLTLDNTRADANASAFAGSVLVDQGALTVVVADQTNGSPFAVGNALPNGTTFTLRGGTLNLRSSGDNTGAQQNLVTGYNVVVTGGTSTLSTDRFGTAESNKLIELNDLTLGRNDFGVANGNNVFAKFTGNITLTDNARINNGSELLLDGVIADGGKGFTLNKGTGGGNLFMNAVNTYSGGTVISGGTLFFGTRGNDPIRFPGLNVMANDQAKAGTGPIVVETGAGISINDISNFAFGQSVRAYSSPLGSSSLVTIRTNRVLGEYPIRTSGGGGLVLAVSGTNTGNSAGNGGIFSNYVDLMKIGNGQWGLSANTAIAGGGGDTIYTPATLGIGAGNTYRFYGSAGAFLAFQEQNVLTGTAKLEVGRSIVDLGTTPGNAGALIRLISDQNYSGNTIIHRTGTSGSVGTLLEIRNSVASPTIENYGRLWLTGNGRVTNENEIQTNNVLLRPGSSLRLDYVNFTQGSGFLLPTGQGGTGNSAGSFLNKWQDDLPMTLDGSQLELLNAVIGGQGYQTIEKIGALTIKGAAEIFLNRQTAANSQPVVIIGGALNRTNLATLAIRSSNLNATNELGSTGGPGSAGGTRLMFANDANMPSRGTVSGSGATVNMVSPMYFDVGLNQFVDYDPSETSTGFKSVSFASRNNGTFNFGGLNDGTEIIDHNTTAVTAVNSGTDIWALRTSVSINNTTTPIVNAIKIRSGGLSIATTNNASVTIQGPLVFANAANVEADIWTDIGGGTATLSGGITATNLTKNGTGRLVLAGTNTGTLTGKMQINGGILQINNAAALGGVTEIRIHGGYANNSGTGNAGMSRLDLRGDGSTTLTMTGTNVVVSEFMPYAEINTDRTGGNSNQVISIGSLTVEGGGTDGTEVSFSNGNGYGLKVTGTTTLGINSNSSPIGLNVTNGTTGVELSGRLTGASPLVKTGAGAALILSNPSVTAGSMNDFTGGITINDGTLQLRYTTQVGANTNVQLAGTGGIVINRGNLQMLADANSTTATPTVNVASLAGNNLTVQGPAVLTFDRISQGTPTIAFGGDTSTFTTSSSPVIQVNSSGNIGGGVWNGKTIINDSPILNLFQQNFQLGNGNDSITGAGHLYKTGAFLLTLNSGAANPFTGGLDILGGQVRAITNSDTFGTGPIRMSPGAFIGVQTVGASGNISSNTQITAFASNSTALSGIGLRGATLDPTTILSSGSINTGTVDNSANGISNGGVLAIDTTYSGYVTAGTPLSMGGLFGGYWYLGSTTGGTYSPTTLGVGTGSTYRLGGGDSTLTFGTTANNLLTGAGVKVIIGKPQAIYGAGTVVIQNSNNYTGGTTISRVRDRNGGFTVAQLNIRSGFSTNGSMGSGNVEVYGNLQFENGGSATTNQGAGGNKNTYSFHPGARLILFNQSAAYSGASPDGRWGDEPTITNNTIALRSSDVEMLGFTAASTSNYEKVGNISFAGGSEVRLARGGSAVDVQLDGGGTLTRVGSGTLTLNYTAGQLGTNTFGNNAGAEIFTVASTTGLVAANGMVSPFIISRADNQFLKYSPTNGFQLLTQGSAPSYYVDATNPATPISGALNSVLTDGTGVLNYNSTTAGTLGSNLDIWALRTQGDINQTADNQANTIRVRSGGVTIFGGTARTINTNLAFLDDAGAPTEALFHASSAQLTINGQITASSITKFGTNNLAINQDQPNFSGTWNINQGTLLAQTPGALGTGPILLNGWTGNTGQTTTQLFLNFNSGTPDPVVFTQAKITSLDLNLITANTANDRVMQVGAIDLVTSSATPGLGIPGVLRLQTNGSRSLLKVGTVTLSDDYFIHMDAGSFGPGSTVATEIGALNNKGLYNVTKTGDGVIILNDNSLTFTGGKTITVNEGSVKVTSDGSLGATGTTAIIDNGGALEIAKANFNPKATLVERPGAIERWSVDGARTGVVVLPQGVHLQIEANQTGKPSINLQGGSIMGYVPVDVDENVVFYSITGNVNVVSDSMLGQPYPAGTNPFGGSQEHLYYDMGKQNQLNNPLNPQLNGAVLDIRGNVFSNSNATLTKVGQDVIQLSGTNSGFNTNIREGVLQLGGSAALPANKTLTMSSTGVLDLNGWDASVAVLQGTGPQAQIVNSAITTNTFTVNSTASTSFAGGFAGNVSIVKSGTGTLTLAGANTHAGRTDVNAGVLALGATASITNSPVINVRGGAKLDVSAIPVGSGGFVLGARQTLAGGTGGTKGLVQGLITTSSGSTISPGDTGATGILSFDTPPAFNAGTHFKLEIGTLISGRGFGYDSLEITAGNMVVAGDLLGSRLLDPASINIGDVYYIILNTGSGTTTGTLAGLAEKSYLFMDGVPLQISYLSNSTLGNNGFGVGGASGNDVALKVVDVPEPSSLLALCAAGTLLGLRRFRRSA